jgi:hypothetical protein
MGLLHAVTSLASGLALLSLSGMGALILARLAQAHRRALVASHRREILALLTSPPDRDTQLRAHVTRVAQHLALAPLIIEVLAIVRGETRAVFVARLARAGAAQHLRSSLQRGHIAGRVRAAEALAAFDARDGAAALQRAWSDNDHRVRLAALAASLEIGAPAPFNDVLRMAMTVPLALRGRALTLLERAATASAGEAAVAALRGELPPTVRIALAEGLGQTRRSSCADALVTMARDPNADVRAAAIGALAATGAPQGHAVVQHALHDPSWPVRARAAASAGALRLRSALGTIQHLRHDENWWVRLRAGEALDAMAAPPARARA